MVKMGIILLLTSLTVPGLSWANGNELDYEWQLERLMSPSLLELSSEEDGTVFIYNGMKDRDIESALNQSFHRIEHMMFVNTVHTDNNGKPLVDKATGEVMVDEDC